MATLAPGDLAPDFTLTGDDGEAVTLSSLRGKAVILYFYPRDDTPGCTTEACDFRDRHAAIAGANAVVVGVSPDATKAHVRFKTKYGLPFTLLSDPEHLALDAYGAWGPKVMYGKPMMGVIRSTYLIDKNGQIVATWPKVSVKEHAQAVLAALQGLS